MIATTKPVCEDMSYAYLTLDTVQYTSPQTNSNLLYSALRGV